MLLVVAQPGLRKMTADISKLTELTSLKVTHCCALEYIPESISCLQKLEVLDIMSTSVTAVPVGLATLASLKHLMMNFWKAIDFPPTLAVSNWLCRCTLLSLRTVASLD
jgi:hypothetical protein